MTFIGNRTLLIILSLFGGVAVVCLHELVADEGLCLNKSENAIAALFAGWLQPPYQFQFVFVYQWTFSWLQGRVWMNAGWLVMHQCSNVGWYMYM